jgi:DtxR family Mn-dependent transcriptional regulator
MEWNFIMEPSGQVTCSLDKLSSGQKATIAYLDFDRNRELHRLLSLGLVPGTPIEVVQKFPTFVLQVNESQLAFDESIASDIFVTP